MIIFTHLPETAIGLYKVHVQYLDSAH